MPEPKQSRIAHLRDLLRVQEDSKERRTFTIQYRGKPLDRVQIDVRTSFPLLRTESGRTHRMQSQYLAKRRGNLSKGFFDDIESPEVQQAQEEILAEMIGERDLNEDLIERDQRDPLVLTYDGVVVDGNRRLVALRKQGVGYAKAVVLPEDAGPAEIAEVELFFQMARDTKAPYDWVGELIHTRWNAGILDGDLELLAKRMRKRKEEVASDLTRLSLVDAYLEWLTAPGDYYLVPESSEQSFRDLTSRLNSKEVKRSPELREAVKRACFAAIHEERGYEDIRSLANKLIQNSKDVVDRLKEAPSFPRPDPSTLPKSVFQTTLGPLGDLIKESPDGNEGLVELSAVFKGPGNNSEAISVLLETVQDIEAEQKAARSDALKLLQNAYTALSKVRLEGRVAKKKEAAAVLAKVIEETERISRSLEGAGD